MLNLQGEKEQEDFRQSLRMLSEAEYGKFILAALEKDLARLDAQNRVIGNENKMGAAYYLARLLETARDAGYRATAPHVPTDSPVDPSNGGSTGRLRQWVLTALQATVRRFAAPVAQAARQ